MTSRSTVRDGAAGCHVFFSSAVRRARAPIEPSELARGRVRRTAATLEQARSKVFGATASVPVLQWRGDIGDENYLKGLTALVAGTPLGSTGVVHPGAT